MASNEELHDEMMVIDDTASTSQTVASLIATDEPDTGDKSKRVVLPANCLVILNGQKCQLRINPDSGVLVAYPVKDDDEGEQITLSDDVTSRQCGDMVTESADDDMISANTTILQEQQVEITQVIPTTANLEMHQDDDMVDMSQVIVSSSDIIDPDATQHQDIYVGDGGVPTQIHDGVEFLNDDGNNSAVQQVTVDGAQVIYVDSVTGNILHTNTTQPEVRGQQQKSAPIDKTAAQGLLELSSTAEEYDPDIPLRIVARSQPVKTKLTTALPKFIIPSVGGNVTSKAIVQEQVAAVTQLPASIRINHTSDDSNLDTIVLDPKLTETNTQTIKPLLKQYLIRPSTSTTAATTENSANAVVSSASQQQVTLIPRGPEDADYNAEELAALGIKTSGEDLEKLKCSQCDYQAYYPQQYEKHLRTTHSSNLHKCQCCSFVCLVESELIKHYTDIHPRNICEICNYVSHQPYVIKRHMFRHTSEGCTCEVCGKTYKDQYILKMHIKMVHTPAEVLYECEVCNKKFNRKAHLKRHMRTHSNIKAFACPKCEYRGCERSDVTKHMLVHETPKLTCEICSKSFRHQKNKDLHMKRHTGQRDFKCGVCDFFGYTFTDIRKHIERRHTEMKTLICDKCGQTFKSEFAFQEHVLTWHHVEGQVHNPHASAGGHPVAAERTVIVDTAGVDVNQSQLGHHIVTTSDGTILTEVQVEAIPGHQHTDLSGGEVAVEFTTSDMPADVGEEFTTTTSTVESQDPAHHTVISQSEDGEIHELTINL